MRPLTNVHKIQSLLSTKERILILFGNNADLDEEASALSLYLAFLKLGKNVSIASPKEPLVEDASLVGIDKVVKELTDDKLVLSIDGVLDSVEKVTHYIDGSKLNIVIHPLPGTRPINKNQIEFSHSKPNFDAVFLIGINDIGELGNFFSHDGKIYPEDGIVFVGRALPRIDMSYIDIVDPQSSCISETITLLLTQLNIPLDQDIASNLFQGMRQVTGSFSTPPATADTFEVASILLKHSPKELPRTKEIIQEPQVAQEEVGTHDSPQADWLTPKIFKSSKNP